MNKIINSFKKIKIFKLTFIEFILYFSLFTFILYSYPLFKKFYLSYGSIWVLLPITIFEFLLIFLFYSIFLFKRFFKYIVVLFLILNSLVYYYMLNYGIAFDVNMLINVMETNYKEASEFFSIKPIIFVLFFGILPSVFFLKKINVNFNNYLIKKGNSILITIFLILILIVPCYAFKKSKKFLKDNQRITSYIIPINYNMSVVEFIVFKIDSYWKSKNLIKISDDAILTKTTKNGKKNLLVFMVGESARAKNFSLNGYERPTNEFLDKYKDEIVSFKNFEACATFTAKSLTCTFSHLPRKDFNYGDSFKYESLLDIFNKVGFDIYWKSNNGKCKNICNRVKNSLVKSFGNNIYDDLLLKVFNNDIKRLNKDNNLIFLHGRGSHGPLYYNRYPKEFEKFKPACNKELEDCSVEEIVNAYDNTIYYTSYLIDEIIKKLQEYEKEYNVAFIFMSDHGQSLGEDGIFMHSAPFDTAPVDQKNSAFFMWFSKDFLEEFNIDLNCLKNHKNDVFSQDNIFHSMLGLFNISSKFYQKDLDLFKICRSQ